MHFQHIHVPHISSILPSLDHFHITRIHIYALCVIFPPSHIYRPQFLLLSTLPSTPTSLFHITRIHTYHSRHLHFATCFTHPPIYLPSIIPLPTHPSTPTTLSPPYFQSRFSQLLSRSRGDSSSSSSSSDRVASVKNAQMIVVFCLLANFGLFLVDHIHFQYNGFLFGVLVLAITRVFQRRHVEAAFFFASLLNLKHIFLYIAPAFFVYLLKICFSQYDARGRVVYASFSIVKLITIGVPVVFTFALSFGPFILHLPQVLSRLFPFGRGLCHAYWAPNAWALYNVADKALVVIFRRLLGVEISTESASMSGGLVGREYSHSVLMPITPPASLLLVLFALTPALVNLWRCYPTPTRFVRALVLCAFAFFLFGWHVHEKAVLLMIVPFTLISLETREDKKLFFLLSTIGHFSLFPLIFTPAEAPIKILYFVVFTYVSYRFLDANVLPASSSDKPLLNVIEKAYVTGIALVQIYVGLVHGLLGLNAYLPFLPLMIMSCYCSVGILYVWIRFYLHTTKLPL